MWSDSNYRSGMHLNQINVRNDSTVAYLPNADFQGWFRPVARRAMYGILLVVPALVALNWLHLLNPFLELMVGYLRLFLPFLSGAASPVMAALVFYLTKFSLPLFLCGGAGVAALTFKLALSPDILYLSDAGITFGRLVNRDSDYCTIMVSDLMRWDRVKKVDITRPANTRSNLDYCFEFERIDASPLKVRFGDITKTSDRQAFLNVLKNRFGQWVDAEAVAAFAPPRDRQSYTELWIAELAAPPRRNNLTPLEPGARLFDQKYQVIGKLGVGGQGTVYLAACGSEEVVLKEFVLPIFPDTRVRKAAAVRFQDEANLLTKLDHTQIVKMKDLFIEDHRAYLVLEHLSGKNLKDLVAEQGPLPEAEVLRLARQMCEILAYLHDQAPPVVHRDFTPDNLILDEDGSVKLIDFSVAQSFTSTVTGAVVGKPNYISPEQFRGKPGSQSDLYSMGATLYYIATGKEPEPISNLHLKDEKAGCNGVLAKVIEKATRLEVSARYADAREILQELAGA